jgi:hypothetical protein
MEFYDIKLDPSTNKIIVGRITAPLSFTPRINIPPRYNIKACWKNLIDVLEGEGLYSMVLRVVARVVR